MKVSKDRLTDKNRQTIRGNTIKGNITKSIDLQMKTFRLVDNALGWLTFFIAAFVYCSTIEPTASFWDCPEFITTGYRLEIGHPPGAPFFMLTANLFSQFVSDPSQVARMVNTMSALLSAATILFLFWSISHLTRRLITNSTDELSWGKIITIEAAALVGSLIYTFSDTFWFSAVEGEVYAYSSAFTAVVFWLILKWDEHADEPHTHHHHHHAGGVEPHTWTTPENASIISRHILQTLCRLDTLHQAYYQAKHDSLQAHIQLIDSLITKKLEGTSTHRSFLIYHPSLSYFARQYGLQQIPIENQGKEPSPETLSRLVALCRTQQVGVIFIQPEFDVRHAEVLAQQTGTRLVRIHPLAYQWDEEMLHVAENLGE